MTGYSTEQIIQLQKENELRKRIIDRLPLCQSHYDKVRTTCVECDLERAVTAIADISAAVLDVDNPNNQDTLIRAMAAADRVLQSYEATRGPLEGR